LQINGSILQEQWIESSQNVQRNTHKVQDSARRRWVVGYSIGWPRPHMFVHVKIESTEKMKMVLKDVLSKVKRKFLKRRPVVVFVLSIF
jgi:ABC-type oligopeptide transport system ATPase subunit